MMILKVILTTLLVLLGIILGLLAMVLLIPLRYQVEVRITEEQEIEVSGFISYFLSAIKVTFAYYKELDMALYLFGFRKKKKGVLEEEFEDGTEAVEEIADETVEENVEETERETTETVKESATQSSTTETADTAKYKEIPENGKLKKDKFPKDDILYWKKMITDEHNQSVVRKFWCELKYLIRHFKFRRINTDLSFGTGDPALTGQILGILCMIPVLYQYEVTMIPDFDAEDPYIEGTALVAGRVRLIHVLITVLRLLLDKEVRIVIKRFMRKVEQHGRK